MFRGFILKCIVLVSTYGLTFLSYFHGQDSRKKPVIIFLVFYSNSSSNSFKVKIVYYNFLANYDVFYFQNHRNSVGHVLFLGHQFLSLRKKIKVIEKRQEPISSLWNPKRSDHSRHSVFLIFFNYAKTMYLFIFFYFQTNKIEYYLY